jgi:hypothetical protein
MRLKREYGCEPAELGLIVAGATVAIFSAGCLDRKCLVRPLGMLPCNVFAPCFMVFMGILGIGTAWDLRAIYRWFSKSRRSTCPSIETAPSDRERATMSSNSAEGSRGRASSTQVAEPAAAMAATSEEAAVLRIDATQSNGPDPAETQADVELCGRRSADDEHPMYGLRE